MNREKHPILCICAFVHCDALVLTLCCRNGRIQSVAISPFCGVRDEEVGRSGYVFKERVSAVNQLPYDLRSEPRLRVLPPTDYAKVWKPLLASLVSSLHRELEENTLVKSLGNTRESYGSFNASIASSFGSGLSGLRSKGRLNRHPHTAQYFSLVNITLEDLFQSLIREAARPKICIARQ